tara:strand:- start:6658 stop:8721 length:2064 start_codon:yes stop_codon:yes gene_type:complete
MAFNGSGVFSRVYNWTNDKNAGVKILASRHDTEDDGFATGLSTCITKDGQTTVTANLPMNTKRHTGVGNAAARTDYSATGQVQDSSFLYAADSGSANTYAISLSPAVTAYASGQVFHFKAANANTGASTLNVNSVGAKTIVKDVNTALASGDISQNEVISVIYDGTNFQMVGNADSEQVVTTYTNGTDNRVISSTGTAGINGEANLTFDGSTLAVTGAATVSTDLTVGDDLSLDSDACVLKFGDDQDVTLTHVADTGLLLNSTMAIQFNDASQYINAPSATVLDINATDEIEINATLCDVNANLDVSGTYTGGGLMTTGGNIVIPNAGNIGSVGDTDAIAISSGGVVTFSQSPILSSDLTIEDDLYLDSDGAIIHFGEDADVTLTHVADTGLLLNSTMQLQFNDASQYINAPSATVLDINATDEVEINATLCDVNANLDVSGTYSGGGLMTTGGNIVIPNAGNIGSASDTDAMAISSGGVVAFSQVPTFPNDTIETADIQDNAVTLAKMAGLARGKIIYGDASGDPAALAVGSNTHVLTSDGTDISWSAPSSGGKVLQVVNMNSTSETSTTSSSFVDTSLTADITPASSSNKVLVMYTANLNIGGTRGNWVYVGLERGTSDIITFGGTYIEQDGANFDIHNLTTGTYLDSPSSTSEQTYTIRLRVSAGTGKLIQTGTGSLTLMEIEG